MVSVVIPAFNEEKTIARVVRAVIGHSGISEVIVVDDGSTDATTLRATEAGATVLTLPANRGKAAAMDAGVAHAEGEIILFLDADCEGFTHDHIDRMITPVIEGCHAMYVGINSRKSFWLNRILHIFPILSGDRALRRELWDAVPPRYKQRFQIEIALNYFSRHFAPPAGFEILQGIRHIIKEKKHGLVIGMVRRVGMIRDIVLITVQLYFVLAAKEAVMGWMQRLRSQVRKGY
jgi:glycosyltransferase involved in cell wall biosynthesis